MREIFSSDDCICSIVIMDLRTELRLIFAEAMDRSRVTAELAESVVLVDEELRIRELAYRLENFDRVAIVAIGKIMGRYPFFFKQLSIPKLQVAHSMGHIDANLRLAEHGGRPGDACLGF